MHNKKVWSTGLILGVCLILGIFFYLRSKSEYREFSLKQGPVIESVYGLGMVVPRRIFELKVGIVTTLKKLFVQEGQLIQAGTPLAHFDGAPVFRAPFSGQVTNVYFQEGEAIFPQVPVVRMETMGDYYIEVSFEQSAAMKVRRGMKAQVSFDTLKTGQLEGHIRSLFAKNHEFVAHIEIDKMPEQILSGMSGDVGVVVGRQEDVILVPVAAIGPKGVLRLREGKRKLIPIKIGVSDGEFAQLIEGDLLLSDVLLVR